MTLETLNSPKFAPLSRQTLLTIKGGESEAEPSGAGWTQIGGERVNYESDCIRYMDDGRFRATYTIVKDGVISGIIYDSVDGVIKDK